MVKYMQSKSVEKRYCNKWLISQLIHSDGQFSGDPRLIFGFLPPLVPDENR